MTKLEKEPQNFIDTLELLREPNQEPVDTETVLNILKMISEFDNVHEITTKP